VVVNSSCEPEGGRWGKGAGISFEKDETHGGMLVLRNDSADKDVKTGQEIKRDESWKKLRFTYWANVPAIVPGEAGFHHARFAVTMLGPNYFKKDRSPDEDKQAWHLVAGAWKEPTDGWVKVVEELDIPDPVIVIRFGPALFRSTGELRIADLKVEAVPATASDDNR
jgi:hypothetical protein